MMTILLPPGSFLSSDNSLSRVLCQDSRVISDLSLFPFPSPVGHQVVFNCPQLRLESLYPAFSTAAVKVEAVLTLPLN